MKRLCTLVLLAVVAAAASVALADTKKKGGKPAGTKAGLEQVVKDYFAGINANDIKKLGEYFAPDYTFTDLDGKLMSRDERLKSAAAQDGSKIVFSEITVRTYGPTGVATGLATTTEGRRSRFTQTWAWQDGRWWLVAAHRTTVAL